MSKMAFYLCLILALTMATMNGYIGNSSVLQVVRISNVPFFKSERS